MEFDEFCKKKKIDPEKFRSKEPMRWGEFSLVFSQVSPESFTQQKKFLLNDLRKLYPFTELAIDGKAESVAVKKPVMKIAPKIKQK